MLNMNWSVLQLVASKHYVFPFFIVLLVLIIAYASAHPYIRNYCKGRLWVSVVIKVLFVLFWVYNFCCYCDWFGSSLTDRKRGLWNMLFGDPSIGPTYGNVFMTSFCGLLTMFLPIILIFDRKMVVSRFLFPIGLLGGIIALVPDITVSQDASAWRILLFWNMGTIFRYMWLTLVCFIGLLNAPKYNLKKDWWIYLSGVAACYLYGLIIGFAIIPPGCRVTVFGIFPNDYDNGAYAAVGDLIPIYPLNMILTTLITAGCPIGLAALKEVCCQKIPYYRGVSKKRRTKKTR